MMHKGYIYVIRNTVNNKVYIGQTTQDKGVRFKQHLSEQYRNSNNKCTKLVKAIKKYGEDKFYEDPKPLYVIVGDDKEAIIKKLNEQETKYIQLFNSVKKGYNCNYGGDNRYHDIEDLKYGVYYADIKAWKKAYRQAHSKELAEKQRERYHNNKEAYSKTKNAYAALHKEEKAAYDKEYREKNKEHLKEVHKKYREAHKAEKAIKDKLYREKNKERLKEVRKQYREAHKDEINRKRRERRAKKRLNNEAD